MNLDNNQKKVAVAGFSLVSLAVVILSGLMLKNQATKTAGPILNKLAEVQKQDWYKALGSWLQECPIKPTVSLKPIDVQMQSGVI